MPNSASSVLSLLAAGAAGAGGPPIWAQYLPLVGLVVIMWFLVLRPQMQQQKEQKNKLANIKKGDQVVSGGGFLAKVTKAEDEYLELELAPNVKVRAVRSSILDVVSPTTGKPAND